MRAEPVFWNNPGPGGWVDCWAQNYCTRQEQEAGATHDAAKGGRTIASAIHPGGSDSG